MTSPGAVGNSSTFASRTRTSPPRRSRSSGASTDSSTSGSSPVAYSSCTRVPYATIWVLQTPGRPPNWPYDTGTSTPCAVIALRSRSTPCGVHAVPAARPPRNVPSPPVLGKKAR